MTGRASTLWLYRAGVVAAFLQLVTLLLAVPAFVLLSREGLIGPIIVDHAGRTGASPLLSWSCLLLALTSAMTNRKVRAQTAARIRRMAHAATPNGPDEWTHALIDQAWLGVIATAMLALAPAPNFVLAVASLVGYPAIAVIGWLVMASIAAAWFAAIAFAARQAL